METSYLEIQNEKSVVFIKDYAVIDFASKIQEVFSRAFESKQPVILDISQTTECDLTFIQLICSFCSSMIKENRELHLSKINLPEYFQKDLKTLGFQNQCKCNRNSSLSCIFTDVNPGIETSQESVT